MSQQYLGRRANNARHLGGWFGLICLVCSPVLASSAVQVADAQESGLRTPVDLRSARPESPYLSPETRGDICMARKMYRDAIDDYRRAPLTPGIYNKIGIAFQQLSRPDMAEKSYAEALKLNPRFADVLNNLGTVYYGRHMYRRAIGKYKRSLKFSGPAPSIYVNLGAAYFARRDYKAASEYYERALALDPDVLERRDTFGVRVQEQTAADLATFHLYLAKTYAKRGANQRALLYLRKALEEGVKDRKKLPDAPEFNSLKKDHEFWDLLAENPRPL